MSLPWLTHAVVPVTMTYARKTLISLNDTPYYHVVLPTECRAPNLFLRVGKSVRVPYLEVPKSESALDPLLVSIPLQLLAYHVALARDRNIDQPRNLAKSVTVE